MASSRNMVRVTRITCAALAGVLFGSGTLAVAAETAPGTAVAPMHCYLTTTPKDDAHPAAGVYRGDNGVSVQARSWGPDWVELGDSASHQIRIDDIVIPKSLRNGANQLQVTELSNLRLDISVPLTLKVDSAEFTEQTKARISLTEVHGMEAVTIDTSDLALQETADSFVVSVPDVVVKSHAVRKGTSHFFIRPGMLNFDTRMMDYSVSYPLQFNIVATGATGDSVAAKLACAGMEDTVAADGPTATQPDMPAPRQIDSMPGSPEPRAPHEPAEKPAAKPAAKQDLLSGGLSS
ncbi:hypothetical protein [Corynebacterium hindlerae]|uniref:hypothetical protein n=2 Tax=Corynebacterium hindlerae TaxID=699041 RepID=UPI003AAD2B31